MYTLGETKARKIKIIYLKKCFCKSTGNAVHFSFSYISREKDTGEIAAAKYLRQEKGKVRQEASILRKLIQVNLRS